MHRILTARVPRERMTLCRDYQWTPSYPSAVSQQAGSLREPRTVCLSQDQTSSVLWGFFVTYPWVMVAPGLAITSTVLAVNILGDATDPRRHR
jgi:hypothetical protein